MNNEQQIIEPVPSMAGYKKIPSFKLWIANQFPYIETDFDAITNYELLQAVIKYLNTIIENENNVESNVTALYNAFVNLHDYVENYFDNLDVQEEINNKLDEMVEDGTLESILLNYTQITKVFNTYNDMMLDTSTYVNGMKLKTLGYHYINDGGGADYVVTNVQNDNKYQVSIGLNKYIEMINYNNEVTPEQFGCYGDGITDDTDNFTNAINYVKNKPLTLRLLKSYYINNSITINDNDKICIKGNEKPLYFTYKVNPEIIINEHDLFVGANLSNNQLTTMILNMKGVTISGMSNNMATVFKGLQLYGSTFEGCKFEGIFGLIEGRFNMCTQFTNCWTINIRNFLLSDYIFNIPTYLKNIRNGTIDIENVTSFHTNSADVQNLFNGCYLNGYNPNESYSSLDMPCLHLLYYNDSEICFHNCFIDFWYAIEESFRTNGTTNAMSFKDCVFQQCIYFHGFHTALYPILTGFEFIGNELTRFGGNQSYASDKDSYAGANLSPNETILKTAIIKDNYFANDDNKFLIKKNECTILTDGNFINTVLDAPITHNNFQTYTDNAILYSRINELNYKKYDVASIPTQIVKNAGTNNNWGFYFVGRKFVFSVNGEISIKTLVESDTAGTYLLL